MDFLAQFEGEEPSPWQQPMGYSGSLITEWRWNGPGVLGLEVALATAPGRPKVAELRELWRLREGKKGFPLLLVVLYPHAGQSVAATCGPTGDDPVVRHDLDPAVVERVCAAALRQPDRLAALRFLAANEVEEQSELPGVRNVGLFATNELAHGVPLRSDWSDVVAQGQRLPAASGHDLLAGLGYEVRVEGLATNVLVNGGGQPRALT